MLDLEEALRLGKVQPIPVEFRLPANTVECVGFRLPDYRYAGSGDLFLYAVWSEGHVLFVDCGPMQMTDRRWFEQVIDQHAGSAADVALFLTHYHFDHMGESGWFSRQGIRCMASSESEVLGTVDTQAYTTLVGAHRDTPIEGVEDYAEFQCGLLTLNPETEHVSAGTAVDCGGWHFRTILLPGHVAGHSGLITDDRRLLFSGDCMGERPPIFAFGIDGHEGAEAIECWKRLKSFPLEWVVTAHQGTFEGEAIVKELNRQIDGLGAKAKNVLEELRQMSGYVTPCGFVVERKGADAIFKAARLGKYLNALNVQHYLAFLEFLYDYEQVQRRIDDDGAVVYEPARFSSFFA